MVGDREMLPPLNNGKYMLYCCGEGYFDNRRFLQDLTFQRAANRSEQFFLDQQIKTAFQGQVAGNPFQQALLPQRPPLTLTVLNPLQAALEAPLQALAQLAQRFQQTTALPQPLAVPVRFVGAMLEQAANKILSFFFAKKTDLSEEDDRREKDAMADTEDTFAMRLKPKTVVAAQQSK